jgi:holin-like protein
MLWALTVLLVYQLIGEVIALAFRLPVPGPVIGLALLFATLVVRGAAPERLRDTANGLLQHLSLLFVPAGVGVMVHAGRLGDEWLPITAALVLGTIITIAVTALAMQWLRRLVGRKGSR